MSIKTERRGPVLAVTLDRIAAHNAFDSRMIATLRDTFLDLAEMPARPPAPVPAADEPGLRPHVVLLGSTGPTFCAGADLNEMRVLGAAGSEPNLKAAHEMARMFRAIRLCPVPVVARVQGPAFGGGVGLACACDVVVAGVEARFTFSEVRLGLVAGVISPLVIGRIGPAAARHHFLTGGPIGPETALRIGLADRLAKDGELDAVTLQTVRSLLKGGPEALARSKELVEGVLSRTFADSLEFTAGMIAEARATDEAKAALAAFTDRLPAPWAAEADAWEGD